MKNGVRKFFFLLVIVSFLQMLYFWPTMPDSMASHFDGKGQANGWAPRAFFFSLYAGLIAMLFITFQILPRQLKRLPGSLINLPNRGFWLAQERREATLGIIEKQMTLFGNATLILIIGTMQLVFQANRSGSHRISAEAMWSLIGAYVLISIVWTVKFMRKFKKPQ
jgi:serine/threonine-protein kinase